MCISFDSVSAVTHRVLECDRFDDCFLQAVFAFRLNFSKCWSTYGFRFAVFVCSDLDFMKMAADRHSVFVRFANAVVRVKRMLVLVVLDLWLNFFVANVFLHCLNVGYEKVMPEGLSTFDDAANGLLGGLDRLRLDGLRHKT